MFGSTSGRAKIDSGNKFDWSQVKLILHQELIPNFKLKIEDFHSRIDFSTQTTINHFIFNCQFLSKQNQTSTKVVVVVMEE